MKAVTERLRYELLAVYSHPLCSALRLYRTYSGRLHDCT